MKKLSNVIPAEEAVGVMALVKPLTDCVSEGVRVANGTCVRLR